MRISFVFTVLTLLIVGCNPTPAPPPGNDSSAPAFFDLATYIDAEAERLTERRTPVTKTITLNGRTETRELPAVNFANDLRLFRAANINKPAWSDKYAVSKEKRSAGHRTTAYRALDSTLVVRELIVEEDQGVPVRIEINRRTGNFLSRGTHRMIYEPARGYRVKTQQTKRFGEDTEAVIDVRFEE